MSGTCKRSCEGESEGEGEGGATAAGGGGGGGDDDAVLTMRFAAVDDGNGGISSRGSKTAGDRAARKEIERKEKDGEI